MNGQPDKLRNNMTTSYTALKAFHDFVFTKGMTVIEVFEDPILGEKAQKMVDIFKILCDLNKGIVKKDNRTTPLFDKLILESSCLFEWTIKLFLYVFSRSTPYKEIKIINQFIERMGHFLNTIYETDRELFDYFTSELADLVSLISQFYDQQRLNVKLDLNHLSSKNLSLITKKIRSQEEYFEPDTKLDISLDNVQQVESLFIYTIQFIICIGKPFIVSLKLKKSCELISNLVFNCVSFASSKMLLASLKLFCRFYPIKCIQLDPVSGILYQLCWLSGLAIKSTILNKNLSEEIENCWKLVNKRLDLELGYSKDGKSQYDPVKFTNALIVLSKHLNKMSPVVSTQLISTIMPQTFHKLVDLICEKKLILPESQIEQIYEIFTEKLAYSLPYDCIWFTLMKRILLMNYKTINSYSTHIDRVEENIEDIEMGDPNVGVAVPFSGGRTLLDKLCDENAKIISTFQEKKSINDVVYLSNMYTVEWETIMSLRVEGIFFSNIGNITKMKETANWICDYILKNIVDEVEVKYVFFLLIILVKAMKDFKLSDSATLEEKMGLVFMLPYLDDSSLASLASFINPEWLRKQLSHIPEIHFLSLHGLSLIKSRSDHKYFDAILLRELRVWKSDEQSFNQTLAYVLYKNSRVLTQIFNVLEKKDDLHFIAKSLGLVTCCLSSSEKKLSFSCQGEFERCDLFLNCNGCANYDNSSQRSSLPEEAECKIVEIFQEIIVKQDAPLIQSLANWSASRVLRHCGIDRSLLTSIFKLFCVESEEISNALSDVFIPLIMNPYKVGSLRVPKKELLYRAFNKVFNLSSRKLTQSQEISEIKNITKFASHMDESDLHHVLIIFFKKIWNDDQLQEIVCDSITQIATAHKTEIKTLFYRHKAIICTKLVNIVMDEIVPNDATRGCICLRAALTLFVPSQDEMELNTLFTDSLGFFFCAIVEKANDCARLLLTDMYKNSDLNAKYLTVNYAYKLPRLFVAQSSLHSVEKSLKFLKAINENIELSSFLRHEFLNSMLIEYHQYPKLAAFVIYKIYISEECSVTQENFQDDKFKELLESQMGSFLIALNKFLLKESDNLDDKRLAVESLGDFLELLGPRKVPSFKMNIMGILLTAFNKAGGDKPFLKTLLKIWARFLNTCSHADIGPHLSVICKDLIPFFDVDQQETAKVFKNFIVKNETHLNKYYRELHFLPNIPPMKEVTTVISKYLNIKRPQNFREAKQYLQENLKFFDKLLDINNPDVKAKHVEKLRQILDENKDALNYLCLPGKEASTDSMIVLILRKLLINSQISDENLLIRIAECLGEIGAIDPGRLDLSMLSANQSRDGGFIDFDELPVCLLTKLANTLDSIDQSRIRDCCCYSIQETLKAYNVKEGDSIWTNLSSDVQRNIKRFFTTKYAFKEGGEIVRSPVLASDMSYEEWAYKWAMALIERIERISHRRAFEACIAIMKYNPTICRFLLPNIFWMTLLDSSEANIKNYIVSEINTIIEAKSGTENVLCETPHLMSSPGKAESTQSRSDFEKVRLRCARTIFSILDNVSQWKSRIFNDKKVSPDNQNIKIQVDYLIDNLNKPDLAVLAFECQAYARALLYMEEFIDQDKEAVQNKLEDFQKYYLSLDEPDGVEGINAIRERPASLMDTILNHEANSQLHYSLSCCEIAMKKEPEDLMYPKTLLRCLMNLDQHDTAFNVAAGLMQRKKQWKDAIYPFLVEASWKLSSWDDLSNLLKENEEIECDSIGVGIGHLLNCFKNKDRDSFGRILREMRKREMDPLSGSASEQGAYIRGYQHILRLHMLNDLEKFAEFVFKHSGKPSIEATSDYKSLIGDWIRRNDLVQSSLRCQEPLFNLQRVLLSMQDLPIPTDDTKACLSLSSAKLARKSQNLQRAYTHLVEGHDLINTKQLSNSLVFHSTIETAKFHWFKGDQESKETCIKELKRAVDKYNFNDLSDNDSVKLLKIKLLFANFSATLSNLDFEDLLGMYEDILKSKNYKHINYPIFEEAHFCLAKYIDRVSKTKDVKNLERNGILVKVAKHYGESMFFGSKHIYESMPRLLSIWCDIGSRSDEQASRARRNSSLETQLSECLTNLTAFIGTCKDKFSPHLFYTSFSQLISRICHGNQVVSEMIMNIIADVIIAYPQQSMWLLIGVLMNTRNKARADKCQKILSKAVAKKKDPNLSRFFKDMQIFAEHLIALCIYEPSKGARSFQLSKAVPKLNEFLRQHGIQIMLPYQAFMAVRMKTKWEDANTFSPFVNDLIYIQSFDDMGEILCSQAKPKKVTINCSDGKKYIVMCKPLDDLRKDARTMELNNLINRLLKRDPETRKRQLSIRTYTVVPLDNDCGLLEWVSNLKSLRDVIFRCWTFKFPKRPFVTKDLPLASGMKDTPLEVVISKFNATLAFHEPPVFGDWFVQTFNDPTSWYMAKLSYIRSTAVMSIVGYIIGLGDRHTENILLDSSNGEIIHVDFNLLFNLGETLKVPERVPFRLTHNMVAAMGVTGYEGVYRRTCEATLKLMREKKEALMSVLQPFVYDPLLEWKKTQQRTRNSMYHRSGSSDDNEMVEVTNTKAMECIGRIEDRLNGIINKKIGLPISVSGQVQYLIEEATSKFNLGRMYVGWSPFL